MVDDRACPTCGRPTAETALANLRRDVIRSRGFGTQLADALKKALRETK